MPTISRSFASLQISRLAGLDYFQMLPQPAIDQLVLALCRADTDIIAVAVVNEWLESSATRPTPFDIRKLVSRHNGHAANCSACCDVGLLVVNWTFTKCSCPAGSLKGATDWHGSKIHPDDRIVRLPSLAQL